MGFASGEVKDGPFTCTSVFWQQVWANEGLPFKGGKLDSRSFTELLPGGLLWQQDGLPFALPAVQQLTLTSVDPDLLLQQQDAFSAAELKQKYLIWPFGHRQTTCGVEAISIVPAVAHTREATVIWRSRRISHHGHYSACLFSYKAAS